MKSYNSAFDLIEDKHQASLIRLKSSLVNLILDVIRSNGLTQKDAAKIMGVTQPRVSDLCTGRISKLSFDILFIMHSKIISEYPLC